MKNLNKTLAIAAFAAISMFSAQTANAAEPANNTKAVATETTQSVHGSGANGTWVAPGANGTWLASINQAIGYLFHSESRIEWWP